MDDTEQPATETRLAALEAQLHAAKAEIARLRDSLEVTSEELDDVAGNCATREEAEAAAAEAKRARDLARVALDKNSTLGVVVLVLAVFAAASGLVVFARNGRTSEEQAPADAVDTSCRSNLRRLAEEVGSLTWRVDDLESRATTTRRRSNR